MSLDTDVTRAYHIAKAAHQGQRYNLGPYIDHCEQVVQILIDQDHIEPRYLITAWLHDVIEDTDYTSLILIERNFGREIRDAVDAISRRKDYIIHDKLVKEQEGIYLARVCKNETARVVKFADMIANLMMTGHLACSEDKKKLWQKYTNAIRVLKEYEENL